MGRSRLRVWLSRWRGLVGVGLRQTASRATQTAKQRVRFSVLGVALAITLLVVVTAVGVGLATSTTVYDDDVDYWIVPESDGDSSPLIDTGGPAFGGVHETASDLEEDERIEYVSPIATDVLRVEHGDRSEYILVVGVVGSPGMGEIAGLDSTGLTPGDPYFSETENGTWTGEIVLSQSAASLLAVETNDSLTVGGDESFSVVAIGDGQSAATGDLPIALVQLSEMQALTGDDTHDQADQFVVGTNDPAVRDDLEGVYPQSSVLSRAELTASETIDADLPLALSLTAFVVAISIGTLFVVTTMGLELVADRRQLATLSALGLSTHSQLRLVAVQTLTTTALGGLVGGLGGVLAAVAVNRVSMQFLTTEPIAVVHPLLVAYGLGVAILIGLFSLPYLLVVTRRVSRGVPQ